MLRDTQQFVKLILNDAGVDKSIYSVHSTRAASASNAVNAAVPTEATHYINDSTLGFRDKQRLAFPLCSRRTIANFVGR